MVVGFDLSGREGLVEHLSRTSEMKHSDKDEGLSVTLTDWLQQLPGVQ
jgi:hypothetical protein